MIVQMTILIEISEKNLTFKDGVSTFAIVGTISKPLHKALPKVSKYRTGKIAPELSRKRHF